MPAPIAAVLFFLLQFTAVAMGQDAAPSVAGRPNVVILLTDDQGTLDVNCYSSTDLETPHMDRLAASGIRLTKACAHAVCCPSRAALHTGRHPQRGGVRNWTQGDRHGSDAKNLNMTVAFNLPHYPMQPLEKFKEAYPEMPKPRQAYARAISSVDDHIGRVLDQLEKSGLRENTIVILMSDNGHSTEDSKGITVPNHRSGYPVGYYYLANGGGGNTGKWTGHKGQFLEGGIRVPAMISYPARLPRGQTRDQIVTIMDWFPTVLELCGIPQEATAPKLDGRSMTAVLADAKSPSAHKVLHFGWAKGWAVRRGDWKLIGMTDKKTGRSGLSLHHLAEPAPEVKNHAAEQPELVREFLSLHEAWEKDTASP